ncbi:MAG: YceD family protein [Candidatus Nanopelagicaceae bacterium]
MKTYHLQFAAPEPIGIPMLTIKAGQEIKIDFRAEAVSDGVLISGQITSEAVGECGRCLNELKQEIDQEFRELFLYESRKSEEEDDELFVMDGDIADIEVPIRDAVVLAMPLNPLCKADCKGLCSECGERMEKMGPEHSHEKVDPRWSGLAGWQPK